MTIIRAIAIYIGVILAGFAIVLFPIVATYYSYQFLFYVMEFDDIVTGLSCFFLFFLYVFLDYAACATVADTI